MVALKRELQIGTQDLIVESRDDCAEVHRGRGDARTGRMLLSSKPIRSNKMLVGFGLILQLSSLFSIIKSGNLTSVVDKTTNYLYFSRAL